MASCRAKGNLPRSPQISLLVFGLLNRLTESFALRLANAKVKVVRVINRDYTGVGRDRLAPCLLQGWECHGTVEAKYTSVLKPLRSLCFSNVKTWFWCNVQTLIKYRSVSTKKSV
jgi:hypothetical protein